MFRGISAQRNTPENPALREENLLFFHYLSNGYSYYLAI